MERTTLLDTVSRGLALVTTLLLVVPAVAAEAIKARPDYGRETGRRAPAVRPENRAALPEALARAAAPAAPEKAVPRPGASATRPGPDRRDDRLADAAREAGFWAAERLSMTRGRAEYYRTGFFLGQRDALDDPRIGRWDFDEGRRFALGDPEARRAGLAAGEASADEQAWAEAETRVREQFMDLSRDPRFDARSGMPAFAFRPDRDPAPTLDAVFAAFPLNSYGAWSRPDYLGGLTLDAVRLRGCASYTDFYDGGWDDPDAGFRLLLNDRRSRGFRVLRTPEDRERFRAVFDAAFAHGLDDLGNRPLLHAFDHGFDDGFAYGAFVHQELDYRLGYFEGFNLALDRAAEQGFVRTFPRSFERAYGSLFRDWSDNPKPAIGAVELIDGNDDGVFEPGERIVVEAELINYGGRSGRFALRLDGDVLTAGGADEPRVAVPARGSIIERGVVARIDDRTPNRTRTALEFAVADQRVRVPLTVSRPLAIVPGSVLDARRNLDGEVRLAVRVRNESRHERDGVLQVSASQAGGAVARERLGRLLPGEARPVELVLSGLPALDLIAGDVTLDLTLVSEGVEQDGLAHALPEVVSDLGNDDLLDYVIALSRDPRAPSADVARARALFLERLRVDWFDAVRGSGNPYKHDYRRGGTRTALGELVQVASNERGIGRTEVFGGLSRDVAALSDDLPGLHPFLRKYMRRLARKLP